MKAILIPRIPRINNGRSKSVSAIIQLKIDQHNQHHLHPFGYGRVLLFILYFIQHHIPSFMSLPFQQKKYAKIRKSHAYTLKYACKFTSKFFPISVIFPLQARKNENVITFLCVIHVNTAKFSQIDVNIRRFLCKKIHTTLRKLTQKYTKFTHIGMSNLDKFTPRYEKFTQIGMSNLNKYTPKYSKFTSICAKFTQIGFQIFGNFAILDFNSNFPY